MWNSGSGTYMNLYVKTSRSWEERTLLSRSDVGKEHPGRRRGIIDDAHPGQLKLSERAYDTVWPASSAAHKSQSGIQISNKVVGRRQNVALSGRVYVRRRFRRPDQTSDLLTTSDTAGYAMKWPIITGRKAPFSARR